MARRIVPHLARALVAVTIATYLVVGFGPVANVTLALVGDIETVPATYTTETLDPPTSLTCTATIPLIVTLNWTATVDARATGYQVFRSTTSGSGFTQIGTVTSRTTTTYADTPLVPGTYYYVLKTYFGSWTSVNSNQASCLAV